MAWKSSIAACTFCLAAFCILIIVDDRPRQRILFEVETNDPLDTIADQEISRFKTGLRANHFNLGSQYAGNDPLDREDSANLDPDLAKLISESKAVTSRVDAFKSHDPYSKSPYSSDKAPSQNQVVKIRFNRIIRPVNNQDASPNPTNVGQAQPVLESGIESSKTVRIERIRGEDERANQAERSVADIVASDPHAYGHPGHNILLPPTVRIDSEHYPLSIVNHQNHPSSGFVPTFDGPGSQADANYFLNANSPVPVSVPPQLVPLLRHPITRQQPVNVAIPYSANAQSRTPHVLDSYWSHVPSRRPRRAIPASFSTHSPQHISAGSAPAVTSPTPPQGPPSTSRWSLHVPGAVTVDHIVLPGGTYDLDVPTVPSSTEWNIPTGSVQVSGWAGMAIFCRTDQPNIATNLMLLALSAVCNKSSMQVQNR